MRLIATAVFVAILGTWGASPVSAQGAKMIEKGQKIFADQKCSMCHSIAGKGNAKGALDEVVSKLSDEDIRQWLVNTSVMAEKAKSTRKPVMPAYTKLTKDELDPLIEYLKSLRKKK